MMAKLKERWAREKEEEDRIKSLPTHHTVSPIQIVEDTQTISTQCTPSPVGPINGDANTSTVDKEIPMNIEGFKQVSLDDSTTTFDSSDIDFYSCTLSEIISLLHKMSRDPHTSTLNLAFMEHIKNALIKASEKNLRIEASIPRKLDDGWYPMIKIK